MKTNKIRKVLIAMDFDPSAQKIAEKGYELAKSMDAQVILLHVPLDLTVYSLTYLNMGPLQLDGAEEINDASVKFLEKVKKHLGDQAIITLVKEGDFAETITKAAEELNADIIVLGSHSRRRLENIIMGSVTEKVLRHTSKPLYIIPTRKWS